MILELKKVISEHPEWLRVSEDSLSFMKVSTPTSGSKKDQGKVILFVFEENKNYPTLCVKTTRVYSAGDEIRRGYENLKSLSGDLFAKPLYLHDDGRIIFSVETVCHGEKVLPGSDGVALAIEGYTKWQAIISKGAYNFLKKGDLEKIAYETIDALDIPNDEKTNLKNYYKILSLDENVRIPVLTQHGDMTPDNVLIHKGRVYLVDCDYVGISHIPGFDLFHFLSKSKFKSGSFESNYKKHFPLYFSKIGVNIESYEALLFLYYLQESLRKGTGKKITSNDIIADFKALLKR